MRLLKFITVFLFVALLLPASVFAQEAATAAAAAPFDWQQVLALFINSVLVVVAVQLLKMVLPDIPGGVKQLLAIVAGPLLMYAQNAITGALGYPIDFGPLVELFSGAASGLTAMGLFDVLKKLKLPEKT